MIIECINCSKKFDVNSDLIPSTGRTIQCGSCNHVWFYKKGQEDSFIKTELKSKDDELFFKANKKKKPKSENIKKNQKTLPQRSEIVKYEPKTSFSFWKLLSYILVVIISLIALILILDTFKIQIYNFFPRLEIFLFSLYETLKDIQLFIKDLI
tara:strand:+ start:55 stop:516 length:462 start_codon:yes stop_codon:yes gene_type:complete